MYSKPFYILENVGNNAFSFQQRSDPKLYVPSLVTIEDFSSISLLEENTEKITFEEFDFQGNMQRCYGLENFYQISWKGKTLYLVDNHNHVYYFWYLARNKGIISDDTLLYHIDEHADTRDPWEYLTKKDTIDLKKVFDYTNFFLNVGNYIAPCEKEGLVGDTIQIRSEKALLDYNKGNFSWLEKVGRSIVLNLDLDIFEPNLDFIEYDIKKQVIRDIAQKADLITVCTSPYFIDQERAIKIFKDIFDES